MSPFFDVARFMHAAGQKVDEFDARQAALYVGLQIEELAEKIEAILPGCAEADELQNLGRAFKGGLFDSAIATLTPAQRAACIDADFDLAWVSIAATISVGVQPDKAWALGAESNLAKIDPVTGTMMKDANGKVQKPAGWKSPDFGALLNNPKSLG